MTVIFFGSSEFSIASLKTCLDSQKVIQVITTPDRKKGRGLVTTPTPVKVFAEQHKLPVIAPENLKSEDLIQQIKSMKPDLFVVASYGKMIPSAWLKIPSRYALNVHPSLLPLYRGAAPINWPLLNNDKETGVSIAEVTEKLDAGDIFYQTKFPIRSDHDSANLSAELALLSAKALQSVFASAEKGDLPRTKQNESAFTYARKLTKEDGKISWDKPAVEIFGQVRGLLPWPVAFTQYKGEILQVLKTSVKDVNRSGKAGEILSAGSGIDVQTGKGILTIEKLKPAGKKEMPAGDYARGKRLQSGDSFGE